MSQQSEASAACVTKATQQTGRGSRSNALVAFLRHYGPIPASDNMYDELIQEEISRYQIDPPIRIEPARLQELIDNFQSTDPTNVILTGTAGDGKTYHCRRVWEEFGGDREEWQAGNKIVELDLPSAGKKLVIVKDLSELSARDKIDLFPGLAGAVSGEASESVYLVAANDGQLIASWRDWAESRGPNALKNFRILEGMLVEERAEDERLRLRLYNLSRLDASKHFDALVEQIVEHPQWRGCECCALSAEGGGAACPILLNRNLLRGGMDNSSFRRRLGALLQLARANRMHLPIRDLLLLAVNIILGDQKPGQPLLTCQTARNRAASKEHALTNPYANAFGANLSEKDRQKYQTFTILEGFGIGRETDNRFDNLLIYGPYNETERYQALVESDPYYGAPAYRDYLRDYLEGERQSTREFMAALERQRRRLFFLLDGDTTLDPWRLSVYRSAGVMLDFAVKLQAGEDVTAITEQLVRGLNRTFCGMMIDDGNQLYLASAGGDGRGRVASVLKHELPTSVQRRNPYARFEIAEDGLTPRLVIIDPEEQKERQKIDALNLQLIHFEYLVRVASGSLPASFSRQCYEDFLDFKLRLIDRLDDIVGEQPDKHEVSLQAITIDDNGRPKVDEIRVRVGAIS